MGIYLGLDSSTQSLTAIAIEVDRGRRSVIFEKSLNFDECFPRTVRATAFCPMMTPDRPIVAQALGRRARGPAGAFLQGQRRRFAGAARNLRFGPAARQRLPQRFGRPHARKLDPARMLVEQLSGIYSRDQSPIWMDSSTEEECREITEAVGGDGVLALLTGSRAFERFTGRRSESSTKRTPTATSARPRSTSSARSWRRCSPPARLDRPRRRRRNESHGPRGARWAHVALEATAPDLEAKLPPLRDSWTIVGPLSPYWVKRYGFSPAHAGWCRGPGTTPAA
jgi:xylulokinase